jgi:hypothetical protein
LQEMGPDNIAFRILGGSTIEVTYTPTAAPSFVPAWAGNGNTLL